MILPAEVGTIKSGHRQSQSQHTKYYINEKKGSKLKGKASFLWFVFEGVSFPVKLKFKGGTPSKMFFANYMLFDVALVNVLNLIRFSTLVYCFVCYYLFFCSLSIIYAISRGLLKYFQYLIFLLWFLISLLHIL